MALSALWVHRLETGGSTGMTHHELVGTILTLKLTDDNTKETYRLLIHVRAELSKDECSLTFE